jgi:alkyldihydroxyacetonephosphate synthase
VSGPLRRDGVWWGWGDDRPRPSLSEGATAMLAERIGTTEPAARVELGEIRLPPAAPLPDTVIAAVGGTARVSTEPEDRIRHAAGSSYPDLIRLRNGMLESAPDAVLAPDDAGAVAAVLEACSRERVAVVPFGGGTSVVGGVDPIRGELERLVSLDLSGLRSVAVDRRSLTARLGPGLRGPEAEAVLAAAGMTLGHFPQSFCFATIGGFAATRSAGQASSGYGRFDDLVTAVEMQTPRGELATLETPHTAAGPSLRELVVGSEGTLGVITDVTVRVRPRPQRRRYEAWFAPGFEAGADALRTLAQEGALPDVLRLSDREETRIALALSGLAGMRRSALERYLALRRRSEGSMIVAGWEGGPEAVARRREVSAALLRRSGAIPLGRGAGESWERARFDGPYLRDTLLDRGLLVETLETSHTWSRLEELYEAVGAALRRSMEAAGTPGVVMCHVSHVYRDGASLYFTFFCARRPGDEIEQWRAVKSAACDAITSAGGTITHHHAVGRDHAAWMPSEIGEVGIEALRAVKERLDPVGVMNPGKLLPGAI